LSAFLSQDGTRIDLASLLDPAHPVASLRTIGEINNASQIVGGTSGSRAFLLDLYACADTDGNGDPDNDGDGLCDNWETEGIDVDRDGTVDLTLYDLDKDGVVEPAERADPNHKDLFVEVVWMAEHAPFASALRRVVQSFADARVDNPDGTSGTACDDGNACTVAEVCDGGHTCSGAPAPCDDGNPCTDDGCDPGSGCVSTNNAAPCSDGDACTGPDVCGDGTCAGGPPVYGFSGFRAPIDGAPTFNVGKAGRPFALTTGRPAPASQANATSYSWSWTTARRRRRDSG
jgi:hypothetical protein